MLASFPSEIQPSSTTVDGHNLQLARTLISYSDALGWHGLRGSFIPAAVSTIHLPCRQCGKNPTMHRQS